MRLCATTREGSRWKIAILSAQQPRAMHKRRKGTKGKDRRMHTENILTSIVKYNEFAALDLVKELCGPKDYGTIMTHLREAHKYDIKSPLGQRYFRKAVIILQYKMKQCLISACDFLKVISKPSLIAKDSIYRHINFKP